MNILLNRLLAFVYRKLKEANAERLRQNLEHCGDNVLIKDEVMIFSPQKFYVGDNTSIGERCYFRASGDIYIGKWCQIANNTIIVTTNHIINGELYYNNVENKKVVIGDNVWIGAGALILPGVTIGNNSVIGAGAVVTKSVPKNVVVGGVPAKVLRNIDDKFEDFNIDS